MVTSLGVILGFLVGFLGQWAAEPNFQLRSHSDYVVFLGCLAGVLMLFLALFRMLTPRLADDARSDCHYYYRTLLLHMAGVLTALCSILVSAFI